MLEGELRIDPDGSVWRLAARRWNRWTGATQSIPCAPRRAEKETTLGYLQVRVMRDGIRVNALAHRLVFRHFNGPIPDGMLINHRNGMKADNRPENLELATPSENKIHAMKELKKGRLTQAGTANVMAKLTPEKAEEIRRRRTAGEPLKAIAADFGISDRTVSKIALGHRWAT